MADTPVLTTPSEQTPLTPTLTPTTAADPVVELDVDEQNLADLRKAETDAAAGAAATVDPSKTGAGTAADAAAALPGAAGAAAAAGGAAPAAPAAEATITVPKARLDAVLAARDRANQENAFLKGQIDVLARQPAPSATPAPAPAAPAKTQKEQLSDIDAAKVKLAERFDAGEISAKEWKQQETVLDAQGRELLIQAQAPARAPQQPAQDDQLYLENLTAQLEDAHPYSVLIATTEGNKWAFLEAEARSHLLHQGVQLGTDARSLYALRETMAQLTDHYGPIWTGVPVDQAVAKVAEITGRKPAGAPAAAARPATPPAPGGLSRQAVERANKLALAGRHPPDPAAAGAAGASGTADITDAQLAQLSDEEITALPEATRRRFIATG